MYYVHKYYLKQKKASRTHVELLKIKNLLKEKAKPKQISNDKHLQLTRRLKIEIENDTI